MSRFKPNMQVKHINEIDLDYLWSIGIRGLVFDLDNTIIPWRTYDLDQPTRNWFDNLKKRGFLACVISNNVSKKLEPLTAWLDIPVMGNSRKPSKLGFKWASETLGLAPNNLAMVGDQLLTDIYGGNKAGFFTILTEQLAEAEFWTTKNISRRIERIIHRRIKEE